METLGKLAPNTELQAMMAAMQDGDPGAPAPQYVPIPEDYERTRTWALVSLPKHSRFLDVRVADTLAHLQRRLAQTLREMGVAHLDQSLVQSGRYDVTQFISGWAFEDGFDGIVYTSHNGEISAAGEDLTCWAVYDHVALAQLAAPAPFRLDDPAVRWVVEQFLRIR